MGQTEVDLTRWLVYLIVGIPAITWLLFTRNDALRLIALLGILIFVQDLFSSRRIVFGVGIGPSVIFVYACLTGLYISRGRFPSLGVFGPLWVLFLGAALLGLVSGSLGTGMLFWNIRGFQQLYFEGLFYFVVGVMAFHRDEDVPRFLFYYVVVIGAGVAATHLFALGTGWRPPSLVHSFEAGREVFYGGVFVNPIRSEHSMR